jgi:hypothetical protein
LRVATLRDYPKRDRTNPSAIGHNIDRRAGLHQPGAEVSRVIGQTLDNAPFPGLFSSHLSHRANTGNGFGNRFHDRTVSPQRRFLVNHSAKKQHHEQARKKHKHDSMEHARELAKKKPSMLAFWVLAVGIGAVVIVVLLTTVF